MPLQLAGVSCISERIEKCKAVRKYGGRSAVSAPHFLVHSEKDNVGVVVVEGLKAGTAMLGVITASDKTLQLQAKHDIPIGHKVALKPMKSGETAVKYGEDIGKMVADVAAGDHVHI